MKQIMEFKSITEQGRGYTIIKLSEMTNHEYETVKITMELAGGAWNERHKAFIFVEDVETIQDRLNHMNNNPDLEIPEFRKFQFETQFYPAPAWLAGNVVAMCNIHEEDTVLEPSAGRGAILKFIRQKTKNIIAVEKSPVNFEYIKDSDFCVICDSFENAIQGIGTYNKVVMGPPFAQRMDITHTITAYNHMQAPGRLVSIISENSLFYADEISDNFRIFLKKTKATVINLPIGAYINEGTNIAAAIIVIDKIRTRKFEI